MQAERLNAIVEALLLAAEKPLSGSDLLRILEPEEDSPTRQELTQALNVVAESCRGRGFELKQVATGWRFQVRADYAEIVSRMFEERPKKYTRALLETLALIAYRQPITRGEIEDIRGVAVSTHIIKTLEDRDWVHVVGHRETPGRPSLLATTRHFLDYFNLASLDELPSLKEIKDIDSLHPLLALQNKVIEVPVEKTSDSGLEEENLKNSLSEPAHIEQHEHTSGQSVAVQNDDKESLELTTETAGIPVDSSFETDSEGTAKIDDSGRED